MSLCFKGTSSISTCLPLLRFNEEAVHILLKLFLIHHLNHGGITSKLTIIHGMNLSKIPKSPCVWILARNSCLKSNVDFVDSI